MIRFLGSNCLSLENSSFPWKKIPTEGGFSSQIWFLLLTTCHEVGRSFKPIMVIKNYFFLSFFFSFVGSLSFFFLSFFVFLGFSFLNYFFLSFFFLLWALFFFFLSFFYFLFLTLLCFSFFSTSLSFFLFNFFLSLSLFQIF